MGLTIITWNEQIKHFLRLDWPHFPHSIAELRILNVHHRGWARFYVERLTNEGEESSREVNTSRLIHGDIHADELLQRNGSWANYC